MYEVCNVLFAQWLTGRQRQQLRCIGQSELKLTYQKLGFGYTHVIVVTQRLYALRANESFTIALLLTPQAACHTLHPVSRIRWILAAVRFTAESIGCVFVWVLTCSPSFREDDWRDAILYPGTHFFVWASFMVLYQHTFWASSIHLAYVTIGDLCSLC
jgi:hypothetical protein